MAGWAATYYFATDPALNSTAATALLAHIKDDPRMMVLGVVGVLAVTVGTVLQAVGLLRARSLPIWVPIVSLTEVLPLLLPSQGPAALIASVPIVVACVGIGYFAWRRA